MAYIGYKKLWETEFDNIVANNHRGQNINNGQLKLQVHDNYEIGAKLTTKAEASNPEYVINKPCLDNKLMKIDGHLSSLEKGYKEFKLLGDKQSIEEVLIQRAVKVTIQIRYDKELFGRFPNADEFLKDFLFVTRRPDLEESKWFRSVIIIVNKNYKIKQDRI